MCAFKQFGALDNGVMKHQAEYVVTVVTNLHDGRQARVAYPTENGINTWGYPCQT